MTENLSAFSYENVIIGYDIAKAPLWKARRQNHRPSVHASCAVPAEAHRQAPPPYHHNHAVYLYYDTAVLLFA